MTKASVTFAGEPLSAVSPIVWKFQTGTSPYTTVLQVHQSQWGNLEALIGDDSAELVVNDARGVSTKIRFLTILHRVASDSPNRVSFLVADRRWKWPYKLVARDYNVAKKTGDRTAFYDNLPFENLVTVDEYDYRRYSLNGQDRWTAKAAVEDVLKIVTDDRYEIESFPIEGDSTAGEFSLQNIYLRDSGDIALGRLLSMIPGAEVYMDKDGKARIIDAASIKDAEAYFEDLPPSTWGGDSATMIDRKKIRPKKVIVHFQREVELLAEYQDDYNSTSSTPSRRKTDPYLENILPTVDPTTNLAQWDPFSSTYRSGSDVPAGTWVEVLQWLLAMDADKPEYSAPWNFETIKNLWMRKDGGLEQVLGATGLDIDEDGNIAQRVSALREHFRGTFRLNYAMTERIRDFLDVRVAMLDPITGARAPAAVWNQYCVNPSSKGYRVASRKDPALQGVYRNVDCLKASDDGARIIDTTPGAADIAFRDKDLGIFQVVPLLRQSGTDAEIIPCHVVTESGEGTPRVPVRDLGKQDNDPIAPGARVEGGANGVLLRSTMRLKAMFTIIPSAPNNAKQFHREEVTAEDVGKLYSREYGIRSGTGPDLEIFVPPGECTARFAWSDDEDAKRTIGELLGLDTDDPAEAGIEGPELPGFEFTNGEREVKGYARAVAAEALATFADNIQGRVSTIVPNSGLRLAGNMSSVSIVVGSAPSAKVSAVHEFPGQQRPISRFAMLPNSTRLWTLGIVAFKSSR